MREEIKIPILSDTMETGRLHQWLKQPGDAVKKGEAIAEVESDKAMMEIEAFHDGYLLGPLAAVEQDYPLGAIIGYLSDRKEETQQKFPKENIPGHSNEPADKKVAIASPAMANNQIKTEDAAPYQNTPPVPRTAQKDGPAQTPLSSPYARGLAQELGLSLQQISPGHDGVIRASQVLAGALSDPQPRLEAGPPFHYKLLTPMHRAVANNMSTTVHTPTFRITAEVDLSSLQKQAKNTTFSTTLLLARGCAQTITQYPTINSAYTQWGLAMRKQVDVGIAVDIPGGLITPVLRNVAKRSLDELATDWQTLKNKALQGRLQPRDYEGATFYLSNLGMFPAITHFDAVVPLGAAAILAIGAARNGVTEITMSCDHRVIFGAEAARFLTTLKAILETTIS